MQVTSRAFDSYVKNLRRTSLSRQARLQMRSQVVEGRQGLVLNPYDYGVEQSSPIGPIGSAGTPSSSND